MRRGWGLTLTSAPPPPAWTPADLGARLALWHDASMGVTLTGGAVSQWSDLSGNGRHATQTSATLRPTVDPVGIGGMPALLFDGSDDRFNSVVIPAWGGAGSRSLFAVYKPANTVFGFYVYHMGGTSSGNAFVLASESTRDPLCGAGGTVTPGPRTGDSLLAEGSYGGGVLRVSRNAGAYVTVSATPSTSTTGAMIGGYRTGGDYFNGHIAALLGINGLATSEEVTQIREYFRVRYSLW